MKPLVNQPGTYVKSFGTSDLNLRGHQSGNPSFQGDRRLNGSPRTCEFDPGERRSHQLLNTAARLLSGSIAERCRPGDPYAAPCGATFREADSICFTVPPAAAAIPEWTRTRACPALVRRTVGPRRKPDCRLSFPAQHSKMVPAPPATGSRWKEPDPPRHGAAAPSACAGWSFQAPAGRRSLRPSSCHRVPPPCRPCHPCRWKAPRL